ncbi:hypothetical protein Leryth_015013 [Lithospermum erythrorhizon]|nr:hypothetical protein Leryth_015013 [Lithospermum erythrorhizon]
MSTPLLSNQKFSAAAILGDSVFSYVYLFNMTVVCLDNVMIQVCNLPETNTVAVTFYPIVLSFGLLEEMTCSLESKSKLIEDSATLALSLQSEAFSMMFRNTFSALEHVVPKGS